MPSLVEKIVEGLKKEGIEWPNGAGNAEIKRTRSGSNQRSAGAWRWFMLAKDNSAARARLIAAAPDLLAAAMFLSRIAEEIVVVGLSEYEAKLMASGYAALDAAIAKAQPSKEPAV